MGTIQRVFRDVGLPRLGGPRKREPRQIKLFGKAEPGDSIQVDVKYVRIAGPWAFQHTALDDCTRFRVLRLYRRLHPGSSLAFLAEFDQEELWGRQRFQDFDTAVAAVRDWETRYNYERFSLALHGRTPAEKLGALQPPQRAA